MNNANDVVNGSDETTSQVDSTTTETQTTSDSGSESAQSTSEVVKTQAEDGSDGLVSEAQGQVKSEKGLNRVQELANARNAERSAREKAEAEAQQLRPMLAQQAQQPVDQGAGYDPYMATMYQQEIRVRGLENQIQFKEAERILPYIDKSSPLYNIEVDNMVYNTVNNEKVSAVEAAKRVQQVIKFAQSLKQAQNANAEAQKMSASTLPPQRSAAISEDTEANQRYSDFKKTGTLRDLQKLLEAKRKR